MDMIYVFFMFLNFIIVNRKKNLIEIFFNILINIIFNLNKFVWFNIRIYMYYNFIRYVIKWLKNVFYDKIFWGEM